MQKVCEECGSDNYCKHCSTCHDCLNEHLDKQEQQLAAAKAEVAEYRKFINVISILADNVGIICKADEILAKHKGE